jgi:ATP-binding cassette, subfamily C, bacterial CydC
MTIAWALSQLRYHKLLLGAAIALGSCTILASVGLMGTSGYLISRAALRPPILDLILAIVAVRFFGLSRAAVRYAERVVSHDLTFRLLLRLRCWLYGRLERLIPSHRISLHSGDLLTRLVSDVETMQNLYLRVASPAIVAGLTTAVTTAILWLFEPAAAVILLAGLILYGLALPLSAGHLGRKTAVKQISTRAELQRHLIDSLGGIEEVITLGMEQARQEQHTRIIGQLSRFQRHQSMIAALRDFLGCLLVWLTLVSVLVVSISELESGAFDGMLLAAAAFGILASFEAVQPLPQAFQYLEQAGEASRRICNIAPQKTARKPTTEEFKEQARARNGELAVERCLAGKDEGAKGYVTKCIPETCSVSFRNVSFSFPGAIRRALDNVSFDLPFGSKTAIIGPSGAGKSTIVQLLCRFFDPQEGKILLGKHSLTNYSVPDLRQQLAVVLQHPHLFNTTIRDNLLLARPEATDSELTAILEKVNLGSVIRALPNGLDATVGSEGLKFSGGERQRLAIAQALLKNAPILVLDEATANLDIETEHEILEWIYELTAERTLVVITHRPEVLSGMDAVLVLRDGQLEERLCQ